LNFLIKSFLLILGVGESDFYDNLKGVQPDDSIEEIKHLCPGCGSDQLKRNGFTTGGRQKSYKPVFGEDHRCAGKESGEATHVERWNNALRQRLGRFVRIALSFSKTEENTEVIYSRVQHCCAP
jgi:hypothetical protein